MKHVKIILAAALVAAAMNFSFAGAVKIGVPKGWTASYKNSEHAVIGLDPAESSDWSASLMIEGTDKSEGEFVALTQTFDATPWQGKLVQFSVMTKTLDKAAVAEVWLRGSNGITGKKIDAAKPSEGNPGKTEYISTASEGIISKEWKESKVSMIIPPQITQLELGIGLRQQGKIWIRDVKFQERPALQKEA